MESQKTLLTNVTDEELFKLLQDLTLFKDIGAGNYHGEWSHFIQWYLICHDEMLLQNLNFSPSIIM
ncbi:LirA/MavJ family T4SS effector [Legionella santicrucis]|uniref:LirA/MavJ family T4SS effector n=1 Tax=Legionella santicrucis TaxID=45074 RepID=UPI000730447B